MRRTFIALAAGVVLGLLAGWLLFSPPPRVPEANAGPAEVGMMVGAPPLSLTGQTSRLTGSAGVGRFRC